MNTPLTGLLAALTLMFALPALASAQDTSHAGGWDNQDYAIAGDWQIETRADGRYLVLSEDFRTRRGPDLKIFFSALPADQVTGNNAADGYFLAELERNRNGQEYRLPDDLDLSDYNSVIIHCERFSKLWGAGHLTSTAS
ncbi:DM13 domain-containing protein [Maricaulis sp. D1M11]|uniref:DM13 domain-containing protein n=1 Tax=Maricaulis sp. D1M11 TaxID=3076117 RepID=UPI0039B497DC